MKSFFSSIIGAIIGTVAVLLCFFAITQKNPTTLFGTIQIIIVDNEETKPTDDASKAIELLYNENLAISADSFLTQIGGFYSAILQISLAAFVLFGFLSFLSIRWQSIQAAEDFSDTKVKASFDNYIKSQEFNSLLSKNAVDAFDIQSESIDEIMAFSKEFNPIVDRLKHLETQFALQSSDAEPEEEG